MNIQVERRGTETEENRRYCRREKPEKTPLNDEAPVNE